MTAPKKPQIERYEYIHFEKMADLSKTSVWVCRNNRSLGELGIVKWHPTWRQYCYFPTGQAVYSQGCLKDIQSFINILRIAHDRA